MEGDYRNIITKEYQQSSYDLIGKDHADTLKAQGYSWWEVFQKAQVIYAKSVSNKMDQERLLRQLNESDYPKGTTFIPLPKVDTPSSLH